MRNNKELAKWMLEARCYYRDNFYNDNDKGHQIDHADGVFEGMLEINKKLTLKLDPTLTFMTAYVHDIFCGRDRENHHELAYDYFIDNADKFTQQLTWTERYACAKAVREHRSSGSCEYSNHYSLAIQIADTGKPVLDDFIIRSFLHNIKDTQETSVVINNVINHIRDKFGDDEYGFKCYYYRKYYEEDIKVFNEDLLKLNIEQVTKLLSDRGLLNDCQ